MSNKKTEEPAARDGVLQAVKADVANTVAAYFAPIRAVVKDLAQSVHRETEASKSAHNASDTEQR